MYKYLFYTPNNYSKTEKFPLLIFLHGAPQRGDNLKLVQSEALPMLLERKLLSLKMFVVAPQCPTEKSWDYVLVYELLKEIVNNYNIDVSRIYVTGFSMGGYGTLLFAKNFGNKIAAAAPVCSGGSYFLAENLRTIPLWFFHGTEDKIIEFKNTKELYDKLIEINGNVKFTVYQGKAHDIWNETYANIELYEWFLNFSNPHAIIN